MHLIEDKGKLYSKKFTSISNLEHGKAVAVLNNELVVVSIDDIRKEFAN